MCRATLFLSLLAVAAGLSGCSGLSDVKNTGGGGGGGNPGAITVTVAPQSPTAVVSQTVAFQATVTGTTNTAVIWEVNGVAGGNSTVGTISTLGTYTAPATVPNPYHVTHRAAQQHDQ